MSRSAAPRIAACLRLASLLALAPGLGALAAHPQERVHERLWRDAIASSIRPHTPRAPGGN